MRAFFFLGFFLVTACNRAIVPLPTPKDEGIAKLLLISGDVRIKRAYSASWRQVFSQTALRRGDQIFTGQNGSVHMEYFGLGASVSLGPYSHFVVTSQPPAFTSFRRNFGAESGKGINSNKQGKARADAGAGAIALNRNKYVPLAGIVQEQTGITMMRDTDTIPILAPSNNVELYAKKFPTTLTVKLDETWNKTQLWGFLWKTSDEVTPEWSGYSRGSFAAIPIPSTGDYTLQIVTSDESRTSKPIQIRARKRGALVMPELPDTMSPLTPVSVVLQ
jgi:hypothetical protein